MDCADYAGTSLDLRLPHRLELLRRDVEEGQRKEQMAYVASLIACSDSAELISSCASTDSPLGADSASLS